MPADLLKTKLYVPRLRPSFVHRPHLLEKLNRGLHRKLTLISAPAGFGKSTVVSSWIQACQQLAAWLSLDAEDSDPIRFLTYFIAALQTVSPELGANFSTQFQSSQPPPLKSLLTPLLNEIAAQPAPFLLVLDDYHVLDAPAIDKALAFLLDHLPPQMHLVITTREDPPLPLARLRARGQMTELRAADLRFTEGEASSFLNQMMGLDLSAEEIAALETRTEGWVAGLQMAALSIQGNADAAKFIQAFTGSHRFVLDYLAEEVLQSQTKQVRNFLLETSILNRLTGSLCDAVTGQEDGTKMLEALERDNLFIVPLDDRRHWYRYHHLFADVLHAHLMKEQPNKVPVLHLRASDWYERNNLPVAAIRHALIAQDFERAAAQIEMAWPALFNGIRPDTWLGWVKALPDELVRDRPVLNLGGAWTMLHNGELQGAEVCLRHAERWLDTSTAHPDGQPAAGMIVINKEALESLPILVANARIYLAQARGDGPAAVKNAQRSFAFSPKDKDYHHGIAKLFLGMAQWTSGNLEAACQAIVESTADLHRANNVYFQVVGTAVLADVKVVQGRLHEAASIYEQALQLAQQQSEYVLQKTADLYIGLGELCRERNDLKAATRHLEKGQKDATEQALFPGRWSRWCVAMARLKQATGELSGALELLHEAERMYKPDPFPEVRSAAGLKARIWIEQGRLGEALGWAGERGLSVDDNLSYLHEFDHITLAKLLIAQYKRDQNQEALQRATALLARLLEVAEAGGRLGSMVEILSQQALAAEAAGNLTAALAKVMRALALAEPEGYIRVFVDEGQPMAALLKQIELDGTKQKAYLSRLLAAFAGQEASQPPLVDDQPLVEPLSDRELEVLQLVAEGLTNREIAERLYLALSTVKGHNRVIYGKLNASRRTEAVARARELGLL